MSRDTKATDWECQGIAQVGGGAFLGGALYGFEFRSKQADFRGTYVLTLGGASLGGSLGGASLPTPTQFYQGFKHHVDTNMWSSVDCNRPFSALDLHVAYGELETVSIGIGYAFSVVNISAGLFSALFDDVDVSGFGTGFGSVGAILFGIWQLMGVDGARYS